MPRATEEELIRYVIRILLNEEVARDVIRYLIGHHRELGVALSSKVRPGKGAKNSSFNDGIIGVRGTSASTSRGGAPEK
jgi:hypothetical protein